MLDWEAIRALVARRATLYTLRGQPFRLIEISETHVLASPVMGWRYPVSRANLEKAIELLAQGEVLARPRDYQAKVAKEYSSYAWGILHELGYV